MARVLIADDSRFMRWKLRSIILNAGYSVIDEAGNGKAAVEKYQQLLPDIVTMDITMPIMGGMEALKAIRILDPNSKVIICSAMSQQRLVIEALSLGAIGFIIKPFSVDQVIEAINKAAF